jgi:predicted DNA-binding transcriptional regulator YafY
MNKRPNTLETCRITLELLRRIPRNGKISGPDLLKQLQDAGFTRDKRTIERHLKSLSASDLFDIERDDRNKPFGYKWKECAKGLALPVLSEQESLLLTLAEQHLRSLLPAALMKSMESFFSQARTNLGQQANSKREREWLKKVRVVSTSQPLLPPKIIPGVFDAVSNALYANLWLNLEYKNAAGKVAKAEVMPLGLAQQGPRLYLVCRYKDYDNERSLALHRIISAKASAFTFERPKDFDLQKYDDDGRFGFGEGKRIQLTFRIEKGAGFHLLESPLSADQTATEIDDKFEITATVVDTAQLEWWLRGFGDRVSKVQRKETN